MRRVYRCQLSTSPPPYRYDHRHDRALSQQPNDNMVVLLIVLACLEAACLKLCKAHSPKDNTRR